MLDPLVDVFISRDLDSTILDREVSETHRIITAWTAYLYTGMGKKVVPRLRELAPRGQRESGGGIHATYGPLFCPVLSQKKNAAFEGKLGNLN